MSTIVNPKTIEEAVVMCTPFVNKLAHKWKRNHSNEFKDLQQAGFCGVCEAWSRFDGSEQQKDNSKRFTTYAWWWIRAYVRDYAMKRWEYWNNTQFESASDNDDDYSINYDVVQLARNIERLPEKDQKLFMMRLDGYTFEEIAEETDYNNLHQVRNRILEINQGFEQ